ncbi:MAG: hypothetical protein WA672_10600 [Candidatus Angelobacter sp.]
MKETLVLFVRIASALLALLVLIVALRGDLGHHYRRHFASERRERLFLASLAFLVTMFGLRALTWAIHNHIGPMHDIETKSFHLHHMVWGILGLLVVGYLWLAQLGTGIPGSSQWGSAGMAVLYGICSALTLDEFALWLRLQDVYWLPQGRESIEAAMMFGALLAIGALGGKFFHGISASLFKGRQRA